MDIIEVLIENPIIAAIRDDVELQISLSKNPKIVFILRASILDIEKSCQKLKAKDKVVFVHLDMVEGLKGDMSGIEFVKKCGVDGIISTKSQTIKQANKVGLLTIQRIFMIDSQSLKTGIIGIGETNPTAIEVMPGVASRLIKQIHKTTNVPVIAGGLIKEKGEVIEALSSGAVAISTTAQILWEL